MAVMFVYCNTFDIAVGREWELYENECEQNLWNL